MNRPHQNILPYDGTVHYLGTVWNGTASTQLFEQLLDEINWKNDEALIFGKLIMTKRKVAWYGDAKYSYTYSGRTKQAELWTPTLQRLKAEVEKLTQDTYNSCLLNLYHDGSEGMAWHSDAEKDLKKHGTIASISLGAVRKFALKHKMTREKIDVLLENGSVLIMKDETQDHWLHRLPPTQKVTTPRINLTFRMIETNAK